MPTKRRRPCCSLRTNQTNRTGGVGAPLFFNSCTDNQRELVPQREKNQVIRFNRFCPLTLNPTYQEDFPSRAAAVFVPRSSSHPLGAGRIAGTFESEVQSISRGLFNATQIIHKLRKSHLYRLFFSLIDNQFALAFQPPRKKTIISDNIKTFSIHKFIHTIFFWRPCCCSVTNEPMMNLLSGKRSYKKTKKILQLVFLKRGG